VKGKTVKMFTKQKETDAIIEIIDIVKNNLEVICINSAERWANKGWNTKGNIRTDFEINYFIRGNAQVWINDKKHCVEAGDILFVDNSWGYRCDSTSFSMLFLSFSVVGYDTVNRNICAKLKKCFEMLDVVYSVGNRELIEKYFVEMNREITLRQEGYNLKNNLIILQMLIDTLRIGYFSFEENSQRKYKKYNNLIEEVIAYLSENMSEEFLLSELGEKYKLNPRYLNRIFKDITGFPIFRYLNRLRIDKAKRLLSSSPFSVLDIALEIGFESGQYMSRLFKQETGMSPTEYRRNYIEGK